MAVQIEWKHEMDFDYGRLQPVAPGVRRLVCRNPSVFTLHGTGTFVIGQGRVAVVDPGPAQDEHIACLLRELGDEQVTAILVTHTHRDHSPGAALLAARTGARTYGFGPHGMGRKEPGTVLEAGADLDFTPHERLQDGDALAVTGAHLIALHTPGHCRNHLCYRVPEANCVLVGDHIMAWSTTVVIPPDGHMGDYMRSLGRMLDLPEATFLPAHGPSIERPHGFVNDLLEHRRGREAQLLACIRQGLQRIPEVVQQVYLGLPAELQQAAAASMLAHALYLQEQGHIRCLDTPGISARWVEA